MTKSIVPQNPLPEFNPNIVVYRPTNSDTSIELPLDLEHRTVWTTQKQLGESLDLDVRTVSEHVKNFKEQRGDKAKGSIRKFRIVADDGKWRNVEHYDMTVVAYVGFRAQANDRVIEFQDNVGRLINERIEEANNPGLASTRGRVRDLALLKYQGYGETEAFKKLEARVDGIAGLDLLKKTIARVCDKPIYGKIFNAEYIALFGELAEQLREILKTKSIRDELPALQLSYLRTAELTLQEVMSTQESLTMADVLIIIDECITPLGNHLRKISDMRGLHHVTGKPLLNTGS